MAKLLLNDKSHIHNIYDTCKCLVTKSKSILDDLNDPYLAKIEEVTELRLDSFFKKELGIS